MPRITLTNSETGEREHFEPVDAREILSQPDPQYTVDPEDAKLLGVQLDARSDDINVPQLQGSDAEMQTGNSVDKYGRGAVVKAMPGNANEVATSDQPKSTSGKRLAKSKSKGKEGQEDGEEKA